MGVQTFSAVCSGLTTALFTNPLDVVKTRLQVKHPLTGFRSLVQCPLRGGPRFRMHDVHSNNTPAHIIVDVLTCSDMAVYGHELCLHR